LREGPRHGEQAELPERKRAGGRPLATGEADELERLVRRGSNRPLLPPLPRRSQHSLEESGPRPRMTPHHCVLEHIEARDGASGLKDGCEPDLRAAMGRPRRHVLAVHHDPPAVDRGLAGDACEQRRLACAVGADEARQRPLVDADVEVGNRGDGAEGLADAARLAGSCGRQRLRNAAPNSGLGWHDVIRPAHMLDNWMPLWLVLEKYKRPPGVGRPRSFDSSAVLIAARPKPPRTIAALNAYSAVEASTLKTEIRCFTRRSTS
jgi:hypothetical protein